MTYIGLLEIQGAREAIELLEKAIEMIEPGGHRYRQRDVFYGHC